MRNPTLASTAGSSAAASAERATARARPDAGAASAADVALAFVSGGTALAGTAAVLAARGVRTGHILSPFDSGGSSGHLRAAFGVPAIGDVRNRMLAICGHRCRDAIVATLGRRLPKELDEAMALASLKRLVGQLRASGREGLPAKLATTTADDLEALMSASGGRAMRWGNASIGNLALIGGLLRDGGGDLNAVIARYADATGALGQLALSSVHSAHLAATLSDGRRIVGQHRFTAKAGAGVGASVDHLDIVADADADADAPLAVEATAEAMDLLARAELACLPVGSLWSSVLAQLLPRGMGRAWVGSGALRVYVANPGWDPEQGELSVEECVDHIVAIIGRDRPGATARDCLDVVLLDPAGRYPGGLDADAIAARGVRVVYAKIGHPVAGVVERVDGDALADALLALRSERGGQVELSPADT